MARKPAKTFGMIRLDPEARQWVITGMAPNVALRIKDVFRRISKTDSGEFRFTADDLHCYELLWFFERWPMEASAIDMARLKAGRKRYFQVQEDLENLFVPDYTAPAYVGLAEGCELWTYQSQAVEMFRRVKRYLLGDDVGLGKTNSAIGCFLTPGTLPAAVIVQAHLPDQWKERIEEFSGLRVHIIKTVAPYDLPEADVYIFSYSKIHGWSDVARSGFFRTVVLDEPQELRGGMHTQKGKAANTFCNAATGVLGLSATPVMNYGVEMWHVMEFIAPGCLGTLDEFIREWCNGDKVVKDPVALGAHLREQHLMLRRTEEDVGKEMPRPNVTRHAVEWDQQKASESEEIAYNLAIRATTGTFNQRGMAYRELDAFARLTTGLAKARGVAAYVRILLEAGLPVLLSGWHREVYDVWLSALRDHDPVMYTGTESKAAKRRSKEAFVRGDTNLMIISNRSGAGLDGLQFRCNDLVVGELDWSPQTLRQLLGRLRRPGQCDVVNMHYMIAEGGSDPLMVEVIGLKTSQAHGITDPYRAPIAQSSDEDRMKRLAQIYIEKHQSRAKAA